MRTVLAAEDNSTKLVHPMVVTKASDFLAQSGLTSYEVLRDAGKLLFLDTDEALRAFQEDHAIVFLSHQWLDWGHPDADNIQHRAMCSAVRLVARGPRSLCGRSHPIRASH